MASRKSHLPGYGPFGYIWALAAVKEEFTAEQVKRRMDGMFAEMGN